MEEKLIDILIKKGVLKSPDLKENLNLQITRDYYVGTVNKIMLAMREAYELGKKENAPDVF